MVSRLRTALSPLLLGLLASCTGAIGEGNGNPGSGGAGSGNAGSGTPGAGGADPAGVGGATGSAGAGAAPGLTLDGARSPRASCG